MWLIWQNKKDKPLNIPRKPLPIKPTTLEMALSYDCSQGGFGTTTFRPQQAQRTHAQETKNRSFPNVSLW